MTQPTQAPLPTPGGSGATPNAANTAPAPAAAGTSNPAPNTDGIWYASYPANVPHGIDVAQYESVVQFFDECIARFRERVPYVLAVVELDEQEDLKLVTNIVDAAEENVRCGMRVHVVFREISPGLTLPLFVPDDDMKGAAS